MATGNKQQVSVILRQYKTQQGAILFDRVLAIDRHDRIPHLAQKDFSKMISVITAAITLTMEGMNLKRPMNAIQILDLAEAVIDTAGEDNLALEDLMLFLQKLVRGEYGVMYESMDIPKFMSAFEKYREDRWQELNRIREEMHVQNKVAGDVGRTGVPNELSEHFSKMADRLSSMKNEIKNLRNENKDLKS